MPSYVEAARRKGVSHIWSHWIYPKTSCISIQAKLQALQSKQSCPSRVRDSNIPSKIFGDSIKYNNMSFCTNECAAYQWTVLWCEGFRHCGSKLIIITPRKQENWLWHNSFKICNSNSIHILQKQCTTIFRSYDRLQMGSVSEGSQAVT